MRECRFPNPKFLRCEIKVNINYGKKIIANYEGCVYAEIYHKKYWCGVLPIKQESKLLFPVGRFRGCWNFNEIRFALEQGLIEILEIDKIVYAEGMPSPFESYVDKLFELKLEAEIQGNDFWRDLYKRFANSLYGKFAQRISEETIYIEDLEKEYETILDYQLSGRFIKLSLFNATRNDAFLIVSCDNEYSLNYSIPSFASYITSFSRILLAKELIKNEKYKPLYCDTDSIFYEIEPDQKSSKALGEWKKENKIVTEIIALKNYKYIDFDKSPEEQHKIKGVPFLKYDSDGIPNIIETSKNIYEYSNLSKTKESLRRNFEPGVLTKRKKEISGKYDKRIVFSDGTTDPIEF
jgi:hypothetical protein